MKESSYSLSSIHLPEDKAVVGVLKSFSLVLTSFAMLVSVVMFMVKFSLLPMVTSFLLISAFILMEDKLDKFFLNAKFQNNNLIFYIISFACGLIVFLIGIFYMFLNSLLAEGGVGVGLCFMLTGLSLIFVRVNSINRFYYMHFLLLFVLTISLVVFLGNIYQWLSSSKLQFGILPFDASFVFVLLCLSIFFRWSDRGFIGIFTTDSISSKYSLRLLFINFITVFVLGMLVIIIMKNEIYSSYEIATVLIILFMGLSGLFSWINLKLLYKHELERFLMKEELRVHNISIDLDKEDLADKMKELEGKTMEYADKLSSQKKLMDITSDLE